MATILIVEDEAHIVRVMSLWLERHGHQIRQASDGVAALEVLRSDTIDMIISDINMPFLDGLGLVKAVRDEQGLAVPIILVSARCDQVKLAEQLKAYDVRLYPKPFVPSRLVRDIERTLGVAST